MYSRCEYGINTPPAKKIDGARKPNSKEFWARGRDSFDYMYGIARAGTDSKMKSLASLLS